MPLDAQARRFLDMLASTAARPATADAVAQRRTAYQGLMRFSRGAAAPCTVEERVMLSQAEVRWLVRSRFRTGFVFGVAMAVCVFWVEWLLSRVL